MHEYVRPHLQLKIIGIIVTVQRFSPYCLARNLWRLTIIPISVTRTWRKPCGGCQISTSSGC